MIKKIFLAFAVVLVGVAVTNFLSTPAHAFAVPTYEGFVNDYAEILSERVETQLEDQLTTTAEASDGAEVAVATIKSLGGDNIENVAQEFFDTWKIGKKHLDNGVLLLVAVDERKLRIQTGYGSESVITDAEAGRIIRNVITPEFKNGDYEAGIIQGVAAIEQQFIESPGFAPGIDPINKNPDLLDNLFDQFFKAFMSIFVGIFGVYLFAWMGRSKAWWPGGVVGLIFGSLTSNLVAGIFFGVIGLILDYLLSKNYQVLKKAGKTTTWKKTWGSFKTSSSSGSSFSSSSSSSFGGGGSGGGGASGGW
jgi:uncharacterized protein